MESASASDTAAAAACPSPMQGPITRTDANASRDAEMQRPTTARLSICSGSRQRYGTEYHTPSSRKRHCGASVGDVQLDGPCGATDAVVEAAAAEHVVLREAIATANATRLAQPEARRGVRQERVVESGHVPAQEHGASLRLLAAEQLAARQLRRVRTVDGTSVDARRGSSPPGPRPASRSGSGCRIAAADRRWRSGARASRSARRAPAARDRGRRAACRTSSTGTGWCLRARSRRPPRAPARHHPSRPRRTARDTRPGPRAWRRWPRRPPRPSRARARGARGAPGAGGSPPAPWCRRAASRPTARTEPRRWS